MIIPTTAAAYNERWLGPLFVWVDALLAGWVGERVVG